jgi:serine protease Do
VSQVLAGSPAEKAGLRRGDVIVAADGEAISSGKAFEALILTRAINTTIELTIRRGSRTHLTHAKTVDSSQVGPKASPTDVPSEASEWAGLTLVDADPKRLMQMGISLPPDTHDGVLVLSVKTGSIAEKAGLVAGDVLLSVQKTPVTGVDGLLKSVENHSVVLVSFWRGKNRYLAALANGV